jgi:hypothetical protein
MNFKTTVILLVLLAAAGAWLFFSHEPAPKTETTSTDQGAKLLDIDAKDVNQVVVTSSDGPSFTLQKTGSDWALTQPVQAPAETFEVDSLVRGFTDAVTHGQVDTSDTNALSTGLASPRFRVELVTPGKTVKLAVGDKSAVGDSLYVKLDDQSKAQIIPADVSAKLENGPASYRKKTLIATTSDQIKQVTITRPDETLVLEKTGSSWQMVQPQKMAVDDGAASDLLYALTGLQADSFSDSATTPPTAFARPQLTVAFSTESPTTAPTTGSGWTTVQFGSFEDILKKNVYATLAGSGVVAKVPASAMDAFKKTPLDLRDKKAVDLPTEEVSKIVLQTNLPSTTQPTTRPAVDTTLILDRRKKTATVMGPSIHPSTQATTAPVQGNWIVASASNADADDVKVAALLAALHPLRADKYLESLPSTQPAGRYAMTITTTGPFGSPITPHLLVLIDPGNDQPLIGSYNGLTFETSRALLTNFEGPWVKK